MDADYRIEPSTLTGKLLLQGIRALEESDGRVLNSKYPNTPEGLAEFKEKSVAYLKSVMRECEEAEDLQNTPFPNVESWCAYLNISRMTLSNYAQRGEAWRDAIKQIKTVIVSVKSQLADHGKIPPMTWVFDATNNFDYLNTSEFHLKEDGDGVKKQSITLESLRESVAKLGQAKLPPDDEEQGESGD